MEGNQPDYIIADLSNFDDVQNLCKSITSLNGLVNCAGLTKVLPFPFAERKDFEEVMEVNFFAPSELSRLLVKSKKMQKGASIVFISSVWAFIVRRLQVLFIHPQKVHQRTCKSNGFGFGTERDSGQLCGIPEDRYNIFSEGKITQEQLNEDMKRYPLKRYGKPEEVAYAVIYLLSDAAEWITGSNLLIDGGYTLL
jgi:NAD(P)-dependent dehydrogenase (short-subunit alcohol dehydrogenase family)